MTDQRSRGDIGLATLKSFSTLPENLLDLGLVSLFLNIVALALPMSLLQVYDRILPNASEGTLILLMMGVLGALALESILNMGRSHITGWIGARFEHKAGCAAVERILYTRLEEFEGVGSGEHLERLNALATVREFYAGQALLTLLDLPFAFLYFALITMLGGWLVLIPAGVMAAFGLVAVMVANRMKSTIKSRMTADERRFNFIIEVLGGIHSVKAMAMEAPMQRRYERLQESCAEGYHKVAVETQAAQSLSGFFSQLTMVLVAAAGSLVVMDSEMTTGGLAACSLLAGRALQPLQKAIGIWNRFQTFALARDRLREMFELEAEANSGMPPLPAIEGDLELRNISFRYGEKMPWILKDVSVKLAAGECIAIVGGNGSGKTTLLALMQGTLAPTVGQVLADGKDLQAHDPHTVRTQLAYLPQHGMLFQGTILQNITMYRSELDHSAMDVADALGLDEVVATMAQGYDTPVGDSAYDSLPRGIKQRIAIARALVNDPKIVLFDEANTAVDGAGDKLLTGALEHMKGKNTMVLVTHRPSMIRMANRVFDLVNGSLVERVPDPPPPPPPPPSTPETVAAV